MANNENVFYFPSNNNTIDIVLLNKVNTAYLYILMLNIILWGLLLMVKL